MIRSLLVPTRLANQSLRFIYFTSEESSTFTNLSVWCNILLATSCGLGESQGAFSARLHLKGPYQFSLTPSELYGAVARSLMCYDALLNDDAATTPRSVINIKKRMARRVTKDRPMSQPIITFTSLKRNHQYGVRAKRADCRRSLCFHWARTGEANPVTCPIGLK